MKQIKLTKGKVALVDDEDFEELNKFTWCAAGSDKKYFYAHCGSKKMHRTIMGVTDKKIEVDHINGDTLDNRKCNLRITTRSQNMSNRTKLEKRNTSGYRGVFKVRNRFRAVIKKDQKSIHIGYFDTAEEAALAFNEKAKELFGDFCGKLN